MSAEVVAQLHPPRLPEAFTATGPADFLLAMGLGLVVAALVYAGLAALRTRPPAPLPLSLRLKAAQELPPEEALLRLAQIAQDQGLPLTATERAALYERPSAQIAAALALRLEQARGLG